MATRAALIVGMSLCWLMLAGIARAASAPPESASGVPSVAPASAAPAAADSPQIFVHKGCIMCHAAAGFGLHGGQAAPDLTTLAAIVHKRYGTSVDAFLQAPQGPMKSVIGSMIHLSAEERAAIARLLEGAAKPSPSPSPAP